MTPHCRAFLLTVLTHESGWKTVEDCLNLFLGEFVPRLGNLNENIANSVWVI